jgi:hypothetical protein
LIFLIFCAEQHNSQQKSVSNHSYTSNYNFTELNAEETHII